MMDAAALNALGEGKLPGLLGVVLREVTEAGVTAALEIGEHHLAPNGFLHAGTVVTLADTCCGNGCIALLPEGATGFTTVELKSNHLSTARTGTLLCVARPLHRGRTTQVWDAEVRSEETGKVLAHFRCTQLILYPRG